MAARSARVRSVSSITANRGAGFALPRKAYRDMAVKENLVETLRKVWRSDTSRTIARLAMAAITVIAVVFVYFEMQRLVNADKFIWTSVESHLLLVLATVFAAGNIGCAAVMFAAASRRPDLLSRVAVFMASQLAKYIPGRLWGVVFQKYLVGDKSGWAGIFAANVAVFALIAATQLLTLVLAAAIVLNQFMLVAALVPLAFCAPWVLGSLERRINEILRRSGALAQLPPGFGPRLGWLLLLMTSTNIGAWVVLYAGALAMPLDQSAALIVVTVLSWTAGLVSLLPGGLGVREAVFIWIRGDWLAIPDESTMAGLAILTRVWLIIVDVISAAIGLVVLFLVRRRQ